MAFGGDGEIRTIASSQPSPGRWPCTEAITGFLIVTASAERRRRWARLATRARRAAWRAEFGEIS
jgi:hypothetical protein